jgi:two-component system sensor histidine kinase HydH
MESIAYMVNSFLQTGRGLIRTFAIVSLILIALIGSISSYIQSRYLTQQILKRDATVTSEFISSIVSAEDTAVFFDAPEATERNEKLQSFFGHLTVMPDVLASNVFDASGRVMWSSQQGMLGERYGDNDELQEAIKGELVFENGTVGSTEKEEHNFLKENHIGSSFVEFYVPIKTPSQKVVGVVEIYKVPLALQNSINDAQRRLWLATALGSVSLFASLFWIVRRMSTQIDSQHKALAEMSALAMIGETAAAVTHSIRNPLASIRAAAEMALNDNLEGARESAKDIIAETDRLNRGPVSFCTFPSCRMGR